VAGTPRGRATRAGSRPGSRSTSGAPGCCARASGATTSADRAGRRDHRRRGRRAHAAARRWGLAPSWGTLRGGRPLINARDDKLATSGAWKGPCVVVADPLSRARRRLAGVAEGRGPQTAAPAVPARARGRRADGLRRPVVRRAAKDADAPSPRARSSPWRPTARPRGCTTACRPSCATEEAEAAWLTPGVDLDEARGLVAPLPDGLVRVSAISQPETRWLQTIRSSRCPSDDVPTQAACAMCTLRGVGGRSSPEYE
jgi:hypothetical protein